MFGSATTEILRRRPVPRDPSHRRRAAAAAARTERLVQHGDHVEDEHDGEAGEREDGGGHDHRGDP
eukprot:1520034-Prymnesium_polylepis.1